MGMEKDTYGRGYLQMSAWLSERLDYKSTNIFPKLIGLPVGHQKQDLSVEQHDDMH